MVYVSSATTLYSQSDLDEILDQSYRNNSRLGVSGVLLYKDGNLMQLIEGDEVTVRALYAKIERDQRHRGLIILWEGPEETRQFPSWSMAYRNLSGADASSIPGYNHEFSDMSLTAPEFLADPTLGQKLLLMFRDSM